MVAMCSCLAMVMRSPSGVKWMAETNDAPFPSSSNTHTKWPSLSNNYKSSNIKLTGSRLYSILLFFERNTSHLYNQLWTKQWKFLYCIRIAYIWLWVQCETWSRRVHTSAHNAYEVEDRFSFKICIFDVLVKHEVDGLTRMKVFVPVCGCSSHLPRSCCCWSRERCPTRTGTPHSFSLWIRSVRSLVHPTNASHTLRRSLQYIYIICDLIWNINSTGSRPSDISRDGC